MSDTENLNEAADPCGAAYADFHETRRKALVDYIEDRVARHVEYGGNDSPFYRKECAYDGMRDLPGHSGRDIWYAAWKVCLESATAAPRVITSLEETTDRTKHPPTVNRAPRCAHCHHRHATETNGLCGVCACRNRPAQ